MLSTASIQLFSQSVPAWRRSQPWISESTSIRTCFFNQIIFRVQLWIYTLAPINVSQPVMWHQFGKNIWRDLKRSRQIRVTRGGVSSRLSGDNLCSFYTQIARTTTFRSATVCRIRRHAKLNTQRLADGRPRCHQAGPLGTQREQIVARWRKEEKTHNWKNTCWHGLQRGELIDTAGLSTVVFLRRVRSQGSPQGCRCPPTFVLLFQRRPREQSLETSCTFSPHRLLRCIRPA